MTASAFCMALACLACAYAAPPALPQQYTAVIDSDVTGNIPDVPKGKSTYTVHNGHARRQQDRQEWTCGRRIGNTRTKKKDIPQKGT